MPVTQIRSTFLTLGVVAFVVGYAWHTVDHVRLGIGETPPLVWAVGIALWAFGVFWGVRMLRDPGDHQAARLTLLVAALNAIGSLVVHVPASWGGGVYSVPYRGEADALQWVAVSMSVLGSVVLVVAIAVTREVRGRARAA